MDVLADDSELFTGAGWASCVPYVGQHPEEWGVGTVGLLVFILGSVPWLLPILISVSAGHHFCLLPTSQDPGTWHPSYGAL